MGVGGVLAVVVDPVVVSPSPNSAVAFLKRAIDELVSVALDGGTSF